MRDRRDGAAETEPVPGRNVALGDRHEAREPCLRGEEIVAARIERALRHQIADREQLAVVVEQKAELHRQRRRPRGLLQGREARRERGGRLRRPVEITAVALDRAAGRLRPEQHVGADIVAPFDRQRAGDVGHSLGLSASAASRFAMSSPSTGRPSHVRREHGERIVELAPRHRLRSAPVAQAARLFARELERVRDAGETPLVGERTDPSIPGTHWRAR